MIVLLAGLTGTVVLTLHEHRATGVVARQEFGVACQEIEAEIVYHLKVYELMLRSGVAFYTGSDEITRAEWRAFAGRLKMGQTHPGSQGLGLVLVVPREQLAGHIRQVRTEGYPGYRVWPEGERAIYTSIVFLEPFTGPNQGAIGYDMGTEPVHRAAMERARDRDESALSVKVGPGRNSTHDILRGLMMFAPIYRQVAPTGTVAERRATIVGWVCLPFRMHDLMQDLQGFRGPGQQKRIRLEIFDGEVLGPGNLLYDSREPGEHGTPPGKVLSSLTGLEIAGRHWKLRITQSGQSDGPGIFRPAVLTFGSGSLISLLLSGLLFSIANTRRSARQTAERLTEELRESEERYQRITAAITDYIYTVEVAGGRAVKTTHGPGCLAVTGYTAEEFAADPRLWLNMVVAEDRAAVEEHANCSLAGGDPPPLEHRLMHKDGAVHWVSNTIVPHTDADNVLVSYDGLIHDVTARKVAELALSESNFFLKKSQEIAWLGSYRFDIRADRWTSSPVLNEIFGIDESFTHDFAVWSNLVVPAERAAMVAYLRDHVVAGRQRFDREYEIQRHSDGRRRWVHGTGELELDGAGQPVALIGTIQDITTRRAAEKALRESEHRLQEAQTLARIGSWRLEYTSEGERLQATPELRRLYGHSGDEPLPLNFWLEVMHPDDRGLVEAIWERFLRGTGPGECEHRIIVHGQTKWLSVRARVDRDPATGRPLAVDGTSQDITERKVAEAAHARLATAVEQAAETIVITDTHGVILYANPAFEKTTGYTCAEALGQNPRLLKSGKQDVEHYCRMWDTLSRGEVWSGHFINRRKDGTLFEEEATISPVRDSAGGIVNYVAVKRDVTREVQLAAQFRQAQKMEAVGQLAGGVAHDFNNILAAVLMYLGLIQAENELAPATQASLKELGLEVQRGATLTRQLLAFSRQQAMEPKPIILGVLVAGLFKMLSRLLGEDIIIKLQDESSEAVTEADPGMIEQVVINLCINARDAMPRGGQLTIRTEAIVIPPTTLPEPAGVRPGSFLRLSVTDTGEGMTPETLAHIFEPFYTTKAAGKGTGLGLATVYGIVQQHHGWIDVTSAPGQGTIFQVHLPASATPTRRDGAGAAPAAPALGRGESILLVEDETNLRTTVAMTLRLHGYKVLEAADGPAAVLLWQQERDLIDLVFTDLLMPGGMSGHDLIERILGEKPGVKVIASTGYSSHDPRVHSTPDNRIVLLRKPYDRTRLLNTVRARLDQA